MSDSLAAAASGAAARAAPKPSRIGALVAETIVLVNPEKNYAQFLLRALLPMVIHVVIALAAGYAVGSEFRRRSMRAWLACAGGNPIIALAGKLAPLFGIFFVIMLSVALILEGMLGISFKGDLPMMIVAGSLLIVGYLALLPDKHRDKARRTLIRMMEQMTAWARGVAINGVITGASTGILLWAVGVQPAFVFGVLAFFGEFLPNIGPVLVAFPVLFVALSISITKFWLALGAILFVQQVEVNFLVPYILGKEMRLNPVLILFFTVAMGWMFGLAGAILALPAAALTKIVIEEFYLRPRGIDYAPLEREANQILRTEAAHDTLGP